LRRLLKLVRVVKMVKEVQDLRGKSVEELIEILNQVNEELFKIRKTILSGGAIEKPGRIKVLKRTRARILTILRERGIKI
jgi:ribosomal protein L29